MQLNDLLALTIARNASDLHLVPSYVPTIRIQGTLLPLPAFPPLEIKDVEEMIFSALSDGQKEVFAANRELDFSLSYQEQSGQSTRFRVNIYCQKGAIAASFRTIPSKIQTLEELNLPLVLREFTKLRQGFVLMTGASGQGKSTTLASLIAEINVLRPVHIVTIEDPIEHVYPKGRAIISQREMFQDTHSWNNALKYVLREDPDIVYIGEMRDYETVVSALTIAETGHFVLSTLHTNSASQTIDRIIDIVPPSDKNQIRMQLSMVLSGIVTQRLVPATTGKRVPVCEILLAAASVRNTIREGKVHLLDNIIQTSADQGMMLFEEHLRQLVVQNVISHDAAMEYAIRPERYLQLIKR